MEDFAKNNLKALGFEKEIEKVEKGLCPFCGSDKTSQKDFVDELSYREYTFSRLCQRCQNDFFTDSDE